MPQSMPLENCIKIGMGNNWRLKKSEFTHVQNEAITLFAGIGTTTNWIRAKSNLGRTIGKYDGRRIREGNSLEGF
jgi:hypothetical protein